jgi:hypothetical protein
MKDEQNLVDLLILGGGAAGLMAALSANKSNRHLNILVLEKNEQLGRKLLATGNGRCNFTNEDQNISHYRGFHPEIVVEILSYFGKDKTLAFFQGLGLHVHCEDGRYYPRSNQGKILPLMLQVALNNSSVQVQKNTTVQNIDRKPFGFEVTCQDGRHYRSKKILLATGGKAAPQLGCDGEFYTWLSDHGHKIYPLLPALTPLKLDTLSLKKISGIRFLARASLLVQKSLIAETKGEFLWTAYGISGIPTLELSRYAAVALHQKKEAEIEFNLLPEWDERGAQNLVFSWMMQTREQVVHSLSGLLHSDFAEYLVAIVEKQIGDIKAFHPGQATRLAKHLTSLRFTVTDTLGWKEAQTTVGGVALNEVNPETMESKKIPGCFLAGEILDVDGNCGGYNLQWAWSSGYLAGKGAAK